MESGAADEGAAAFNAFGGNMTTKKIPTKRVYICSPFKSDIKRNTRNAQAYCRFAFEQGFVPIAPHLFYPQFFG